MATPRVFSLSLVVSVSVRKQTCPVLMSRGLQDLFRVVGRSFFRLFHMVTELGICLGNLQRETHIWLTRICQNLDVLPFSLLLPECASLLNVA